MINTELFQAKYLYPQTEPDNQGNTRKLTIEPNMFKDSTDCEGLKFAYSFGKGEAIYYTADLTICQAFIDGLRDVLKKSEKDVITLTNNNGNKGAVSLSVGRGDDLVPFVALSGEVNGQRRTKKFFFPTPKGYVITRNGQPISDLESAERMARAFVERFHVFQEWLDGSYKKRQWNNTGGGQPGRGGYNSGGGNNNSRPPSDTSFDDQFI